MPAIGETLREARLRRGLDIADLEDHTKIRAKYLRALENEEWEQLPGPTFVRTFLRTYAEVVGLDPQLLIEEYRVTHEPEEADLAPLTGPPAAAGRERRRPPGPPPRAAVAVVLVVAFVGLLLVLGLTGDDPSDGERAGDSNEGGRAADTERAGDGATPTERRRARRQRERERTPTARVIVRVTPIEPTYLCLDSGEGTDVDFEGIIDAARTFRDPETLRLNLGKRSVEMVANGDPVTIPDSPAPYAVEVTRAGAEEITEGVPPCG